VRVGDEGAGVPVPEEPAGDPARRPAAQPVPALT
jgi:hypothetical protein